jgi:2-C-methyl-D-erythritol 2,4-cyclodiphosphate synthase
MTIRTGIGYDVHRFVTGRPLRLGGVEIPFDRGLEGHSDADVLLHAICDALLGAGAMGDIGQHFPPSDPAYLNANSLDLLSKVRSMLDDAGLDVVNIDASVICEEPKIGPHASAMQLAIASATRIEPTSINIKATTNEGMGFIGRGEGIAAIAIATIQSAEAG